MQIVSIGAQDWESVREVQAHAYPPALHEAVDVLRDKQRLGPESCWCVQDDGRVCAYLLAHPWSGALPPAWGKNGLQMPGEVDQLFLHDMAILPHRQGQGLAAALLVQASDWARGQGLPRLTLVAVLDAAGYWQRQGFVPVEPAQVVPAYYGPGAQFMQKLL